MFVDENLAAWLDDAAAVLSDADAARHQMAKPTYPAGAPAIADMKRLAARFGDRDLSERILWIVNGWTIVAGAHLSALGALCRAREIVFGPMPLVRAAFEYSGRVVWILAEDLSPEQRVARVLLEELRAAEETVKIASRLAGKRSEPHNRAREALIAVRAEITRCFPEAVVSGSAHEWRAEGQHLASPTESINHYGTRWGDPRQWTGVYDLLSGHSHPGLAIFEMFGVDDDGMPVSTTDRATVEKLLRMAVVPYYQSLRHLQAYTRWDLGPLDEWESRIYSTFGAA